MTTVLFVGGAGRSGSTVLANALGSAPSAVSVGELRYLFERGMIEDRLCGCGKSFSSCPFWAQVLQQAFGDDRPEPHREHDVLTRLTRMRQLPQIILRRRAWTGQVRAEPVLEHLAALYRAVADVSGAEVVVDSSKLPTFAAVLSTIEGLDLRILHLVRDPRAVAYAWTRAKEQPDRGRPGLMEQRGVVKSSGLWLVWNVALRHLWKDHPSAYLRLGYEEFARDPAAALRQVAQWVGLSIESALLDGGRIDLATAHTVAGNPARLSHGPTPIRVDDAWVNRLSAGQRRLVWSLTAPLARRFGYSSAVSTLPSSG